MLIVIGFLIKSKMLDYVVIVLNELTGAKWYVSHDARYSPNSGVFNSLEFRDISFMVLGDKFSVWRGRWIVLNFDAESEVRQILGSCISKFEPWKL